MTQTNLRLSLLCPRRDFHTLSFWVASLCDLRQRSERIALNPGHRLSLRPFGVRAFAQAKSLTRGRYPWPVAQTFSFFAKAFVEAPGKGFLDYRGRVSNGAGFTASSVLLSVSRVNCIRGFKILIIFKLFNNMTPERGQKRIPKRMFEKIRKLVPLLTVDGIVFLDGKVLLVKRSIKPYRGYWCLPGGHVRFGETVEEAVTREAKEETGLDVEIERMVGIYSEFKRDPRGHSITIAYILKPIGGEIKHDESEASDIRYFRKLPKKMGFDHRKIITDARLIMRNLKT